MKLVLSIVIALLLQSCAMTTPKTDALVKDHGDLPEVVKIKTVSFIKQDEYQCGPASLAMMLRSQGVDVELKSLIKEVYTPGAKGSSSTDMISAVKARGLVAVEIHELKSLLTEISSGYPVLVFQNLGFSWLPNWHYAVALGYDLTGPDIILHSGEDAYLKTDLRVFERSWSLAHNWGLLVLRPGELASTADDLAHVAGISGLEQVGKLNEAKIAYEAVLKRWPQSLPALIGISNVFYQQKNYFKAVEHLSVASEFHSQSSMVWHNLATAQGSAGLKQEAQKSARKALDLVEASQSEIYKESLKDWL